MRHAKSEQDAATAAVSLKDKLEIPESNPPKIGVILGTGWGGALDWKNRVSCHFSAIPGFTKLAELPGHARQVVYGEVDHHPLIALQGRVHLNEAPCDPDIHRMVRLQVEMLIQLGVETLIVTAAAGSLRSDIEVGDLIAVNGFVTLFAPEMPLYAGEFVSPEDVLNARLRQLALSAIYETTGQAKYGGYAMVRGPFFEGRTYDKALLALSGASTIGMSTLPEACIAALYAPKVQLVALNFVTNTASEAHSHEENTLRAQAKSADMGRVLRSLIGKIRQS